MLPVIPTEISVKSAVDSASSALMIRLPETAADIERSFDSV